jgi:hypothetical protein
MYIKTPQPINIEASQISETKPQYCLNACTNLHDWAAEALSMAYIIDPSHQ